MFNLFNSGTKYQKLARQHNCNLVESNGYWYLYQDGQLVARETTPQNAKQHPRTRNNNPERYAVPENLWKDHASKLRYSKHYRLINGVEPL